MFVASLETETIMSQAAEPEYTTMRAPKDIARMVGILASLDGKTIGELFDTDFREWVQRRYDARIAKEGRKAAKAGPVAAHDA